VMIMNAYKNTKNSCVKMGESGWTRDGDEEAKRRRRIKRKNPASTCSIPGRHTN
jgi:hypothetical protein